MSVQTGIRLLSSLRRTKSKSALYDTPRHFFAIEEEAAAFDWLVSYVEEFNAWPTPATFAQETGVRTVITKEPLGYYQNKARQHSMWEAGLPLFKKMQAAYRDQDPDEAMALARQMVAMEASYNAQRNGLTTLAASMTMVMDDFDVAKRSVGLRGVPTGFEFTDELTDGYQNANLYSTVARPGVGKTYRLLKAAKAARDAGFSVCFLTMEMGVVQIGRRFFGMETGVNPKFLREGRLSTAVEREVRRQADILADGEGPPFFWLAGNFKKTVDSLKAAAYETQADLIIADASYLMKPSDRTKFNARHEILGNVMQAIHQLSVDVNRPVVQSVQFNRMAVQRQQRQSNEEENTDPLAHMSLDKIAGTDEIGQLSSFVEGLCVFDPPYQNTRRYGGVLKGREGETGWWAYNYQFQPYNMDQIMTHRDRQVAEDNDAPPPDLGFMDAGA